MKELLVAFFTSLSFIGGSRERLYGRPVLYYYYVLPERTRDDCRCEEEHTWNYDRLDRSSGCRWLVVLLGLLSIGGGGLHFHHINDHHGTTEQEEEGGVQERHGNR